MLSLLCGSPDIVDSPFYDNHSRRSRSRRSIRGVLSRSGSGASKSDKKKRVLKGSIGAPMDFKHEGHVGADNMMMMAPTGSWDLDQWRAEIEKHMVQPLVTSQPVVETSPLPSPVSIQTPRRKPVPSLLPPSHDSPQSSVPSSPTRSAPLVEAI
ncbi:hypothetical protein RhiJN_02727 [Ceratobasidium sp. AG-Ba]|nr:hypothetical protein RhiJN_02727 [Ceratobasidium sp. AG-Ba]QRW03620.1 hypothetical protein RhiLY_02619 [Ceratobasidium sp. AG-Ba]